MNKIKFGIIGGGNMAEAILAGGLNAGVLQASDVICSDISTDRLSFLSTRYGITTINDNNNAVQNSDIILLAVKPQICEKVVSKISSDLANKSIISIVTGWNAARFSKLLPDSAKLLCVMPNTPALVGEGMSVFAKNSTLQPETQEFAHKLFESIGEVVVVEEKYMSAVVGVSGSGPAYVYLFIQSMADGGVYKGLSREVALKLATQTVLGAAKMIQQSGIHPDQLKDMVCSPGGTTIEAIYELENSGFRGSVMRAVDAAATKAGDM